MVEVEGDFEAGDAVEVAADGRPIGKGIVNYSADELRRIKGMKTAEVRATDDRGRHTTTHRALIPLPSGACLIDTPGMRELKPTGEEDLSEGGFADIEALAADCRFRDCTHGSEPGCAVRAAVEAGMLSAARLGRYLKLRDELSGAAGQLASRMAQKTESRPTGKPAPRSGGRPGVKPAKRGTDWTRER